VGDHVFLKVKARHSSLKLGKCSKLAARYCGPFEILERIGHVAYMLSFPASLCIHNVFHVSFLKKYVPDFNHIIDWNVIQVEPEDRFQVRLVCILDSENQVAPESSHGAGKGPMDLVQSRMQPGNTRMLCE
jgi:hypothetical protein